MAAFVDGRAESGRRQAAHISAELNPRGFLFVNRPSEVTDLPFRPQHPDMPAHNGPARPTQTCREPRTFYGQARMNLEIILIDLDLLDWRGTSLKEISCLVQT